MLRVMQSRENFRQQMMARTKSFALRVYNLCNSLPNTIEAKHIRNQLFRCATSVAANYRAAHRAKSDKDYLNKLKICEEESDETCFWLDMCVECRFISLKQVADLMREAEEITSIIVTSCITKRRNIEAKKSIINS